MLAQYRIQKSSNHPVVKMTALLLNSISVTTSGAFRVWNDMLFPSIVSTICMSGIGIPAGYGFWKLYNKPSEMMVYMRDIAIVIYTQFPDMLLYEK